MLYQIIITIGLAIFALNFILNLRALKTPSKDAKIPEPTPLVSVLVPARNEQENIRVCLESLQKQDYPNFEILVLDDNSSDNTADIVSQIAATDSRVRLLKGQPLAEGWAGKPFACHQLAEQAGGTWLMFVDADTIHAPHMLRSTLSLAIGTNASLLSGFPRQLADSLPQKIALPLMYFVIMIWIPLWWLQGSRKPRPALAIGQFLLFPRDEYWRIGGHRAVRDKIIEDVWLGVETTRHGGRHVVVDLSLVVWCNMYRDVGAMWEGFIKWMYSVASLSPVALVGLMAAGYLFFLAPFYWLWHEFVMLGSPTLWRLMVASQVAIIVAVHWLVDKRFKEPTISALLHPIGLSFLLAAAVYAGWRKAVGAGVRWKNRLYSETSGVK
jgi:chlorobactene glucosyltransferase